MGMFTSADNDGVSAVIDQPKMKCVECTRHGRSNSRDGDHPPAGDEGHLNKRGRWSGSRGR
jgi:hypothetical protein